MKKFIEIVFLSMVFIISFQVDNTAKASTGTNVSGIIKEDTTWTMEGSPYNLTGDIQITNNAKLKLEAGVTIKGNNNRIRVFGIFESIGNSNSKIILNKVNIEPYSNNFYEQFLIQIENTKMFGGSLYRPTGHTSLGSLILRDSRLIGLESNLFFWDSANDIYIERNAFINSGGIKTLLIGTTTPGKKTASKVYILNNAFYNQSDFAVQSQHGNGGRTVVKGNSFLSAEKIALKLPSGGMTATNNYWGTTDKKIIGNMIFDKNDDLTAATYLNFNPYLVLPDINTPTIDVTPPQKPTVDKITAKSRYITGKAEKYSTIEVFIANSSLVGTGITDSNGNFKINIDSLSEKTKLLIISTDDWFNNSVPTIVFVEDMTPPNPPTTNQVSEKSTSVFGASEIGTFITVKAGTTILGTTTTDKYSKYSVTILKQKAGKKLTVTATDSAGNVSKVKEIIVKDVTAPTVPTVNAVSDNASSITGKAESNAKVYATVGSKKIGETTAKSGAFTIKIIKQKAGTRISVYAVDIAGNKSASKTVKVIDKTAPSVPTVNKISSKSVTATGKGEKGASIYIYYGSKKIGQGIVDNRGNYNVKIKTQKKGSTLKVYAQDKSGNKSMSKTVKVS